MSSVLKYQEAPSVASPKDAILKSTSQIIFHPSRLSTHKGRITPKLFNQKISRIFIRKDGTSKASVAKSVEITRQMMYSLMASVSSLNPSNKDDKYLPDYHVV